MLRFIFVFGILAVGIAYAAQGPFYALLLYLWYAYFRPDVWTYYDVVATLNISLFLGLYLVATTILSMPQVKLGLRTGLVLAFFAQVVVSTTMSEHSAVSWEYLWTFSKVILATLLIVVLVTDARRFRLTLLVIAFSLGFEATKQGWAQLVLNPGAPNTNPIPFLGDNNGVAVGMMMLLPIFGALSQTASKKWEVLLYRFFGIGVFLKGITTYSRGGFLAAAIVGAFTLLRSPRRVPALLGVALISGMVLAIMPAEFWERMDTMTQGVEGIEGSETVPAADNSMRGRLHFWQVAVTMAEANPLTGVGLDAFSRSYDTYTWSDEFGTRRAVHSVWFGVLAELGYPGLILFFLVWLMAVWSCFSVARIGQRDPEKKHLAIYANALMTGLVVFAVSGSFLTLQYNEMFWHYIGLSSALHLVARKKSVPATQNAIANNVGLRPALARP